MRQLLLRLGTPRPRDRKMPVVVGDFFVRFPAFDEVSSSAVEAQLEDAWSILDRASFPNDTLHARAVMLMAAHNLTLTGLGKTTEAQIVSQGFSLDSIQSVSDGGVSVSLAKSDSQSRYGSTSFGRELDKLLKQSRVKFAVIGGGAPSFEDYTVDGFPYG